MLSIFIQAFHSLIFCQSRAVNEVTLAPVCQFDIDAIPKTILNFPHKILRQVIFDSVLITSTAHELLFIYIKYR